MLTFSLNKFCRQRLCEEKKPFDMYTALSALASAAVSVAAGASWARDRLGSRTKELAIAAIVRVDKRSFLLSMDEWVGGY